jgi:hypothetical protein
MRKLFTNFTFVAALLLSTSCGNSNQNVDIAGIDGPSLNLKADKIEIVTTFKNISLEGRLRYAIPKYANSYIDVTSAGADGTKMTISIAAKDIINVEALSLPPRELPGGRALPGVSTGSLPAVAFSLPNWKNMTLYVGPKFFGVFFPTSVDIGTNNILTSRYYSGSNRAGTLSLVGPDNSGANSGFVLLLDLNASTRSQLKKIAKRYK